MTLITLEEASTWFSANGWPEDVREDSLPLPRFDFVLPKDSGRKTALARAISQAYDDELAVWISHDEWMRIHSRDDTRLRSWDNYLESTYGLERR